MNKYIKVSYSLYTISDEGKQDLVERATEAHPFQFISGMGVALDAFEQHVADLEQGEEFNFVLSQDDAYGPYEQEHVLDLNKEMFCIDGHFDAQNIYPGAFVPLMNEDGNHFQGKIVEVGENTVKVDLNHPLAGQTLQFKGRILESREATNKEIEGLLNMMSSDGCGCEDCNCEHHHHDEKNGKCGCGHHHHENGHCHCHD